MISIEEDGPNKRIQRRPRGESLLVPRVIGATPLMRNVLPLAMG